MPESCSRWLPIRVAGYMLLCAVLLWVVVHSVQEYGPRGILRENGKLEYVQLAVLFVTLVLLLVLSFSREKGRALWIFLATLAFAACFREMDEIFEKVGAKFVRKRLPYLVGLVALVYCFRRYRDFLREVRAFLAHPSSILMVIGLLMVLWAEILGHRQTWKTFGRWYELGMAKRLVEEGLEACSYVLILSGCVEELIWRKRNARADE